MSSETLSVSGAIRCVSWTVEQPSLVLTERRA